MHKIELSNYQGVFVLIDQDDMPKVAGISLSVSPQGYVRGKQNGKNFVLHRLLMGITDPKVIVIHKNGDHLDNRKENLRVTTPTQKRWNQKLNKRSKSSYHGVRLHEPTNTWHAVIYHLGKYIRLGRYHTQEDAAKARDAKAKELYGEFAKLNFPDCDAKPDKISRNGRSAYCHVHFVSRISKWVGVIAVKEKVYRTKSRNTEYEAAVMLRRMAEQKFPHLMELDEYKTLPVDASVQEDKKPTSKYIGVKYMKNSGAWTAHIRVGNVGYHGGTHESEIQAAIAVRKLADTYCPERLSSKRYQELPTEESLAKKEVLLGNHTYPEANTGASMNLLFVGERPSPSAIKMNVTWENGRLAAKQLFDALRSCSIDPAECTFINVFNQEADVVNKSALKQIIELAKSGSRVIAMGKKVTKVLEDAGIAFQSIVHPAARGSIRRKDRYNQHFREIILAGNSIAPLLQNIPKGVPP